MRKIIFWMLVSLDGYFEGPNHELDWHHVDDELQQHFNDHVGKMAAFLHGRRTYDLMAQFWPTVDRDYAGKKAMVEHSGVWKRMPKIVYSRTLKEPAWNSTVVRSVVPEEVRALKAQPGGDMVLTGAEIGAEFMRLDLVDEVRLYVNPVVLGKGKRLFPEGTGKVGLKLVETRAFGNGVVMVRYGRIESI